MTYTTNVTNNGPQAAGNVTVKLPVPAGATFVSATGGGWACLLAASTVTCTRPMLAVGAAPVIAIVVTAPSAAGTMTATATVSSTTGDPAAANNTSTAMTSIVVGVADLAITLTDVPDPVNTSSPLTYTAVVINAGPQAANAMSTTFGVPGGATFGSAMGAGWACAFTAPLVTCTSPSLAKGASGTITIVVTAPAAGGAISATAKVTSMTADSSNLNNSSTTMTTVQVGGGDTDGDGTPNLTDLDDDDDGMAQVCADANNDNVCDAIGIEFEPPRSRQR